MRDIQDPTSAAKLLVDHALARFSTDNLSCMVVRFQKDALLESQNNRDNPIGVEGDNILASGKISETEKIVGDVKKQIAEGGTAVGVSASNNGKGHDPVLPENASSDATTTTISDSLEEEPEDTDSEVERQSRKPAIDSEPDPSKSSKRD